MLKTDYTTEVASTIKALNYSPQEEFLKEHQYTVVQYYIKIMKLTRGMLIFHTPGSGKTIVAEAIADHFRHAEPERQVIVLMPKSLRENFVKSIHLYMKNDPHATAEEKSPEYIEEVAAKFKFVNLGASNMFSQMERMGQEDIDEVLGEFLHHESIFENKLVIVDEVHNLSNAIANGSKNGIQFYDRIMEARNIKLLFMTATPMINNPFELVPIFNMLKGPLRVGKELFTLFPELPQEFEDFYVNREDMVPKNGEKFKHRIYGLVSYYGYDYSIGRLPGFPEQLPTIEVKVPMSNYQYSQYLNMRDIEIKEEARKTFFSAAAQRFSEKSSATSSYRVRSRQVSNFAYPEQAVEMKGYRVLWHPEKITTGDLRNLDTYSPKMVALLKNLKQPGADLIYSQFRPVILSKVLELNGYVEYEPYGDNTSKEDRFAIITGDVHIDRRNSIVRTWNTKENMDGGVIKVLIITSTGAEGLDLKYGRRVHILEPFWNDARHEQVIARIVRYGSHADMPASKQNVQPYVYLSTYPTRLTTKDLSVLDEHTTDLKIWLRALNNKKLILGFRRLLIESSIDCPMNLAKAPAEVKARFRCLTCVPNGAPLFHPNIHRDMIMPNRCIEPEYKTLKVEEIEIPELDQKAYFRFDNGRLHIYYMDKATGTYMPMTNAQPHYTEIAKAILKTKKGH